MSSQILRLQVVGIICKGLNTMKEIDFSLWINLPWLEPKNVDWIKYYLWVPSSKSSNLHANKLFSFIQRFLKAFSWTINFQIFSWVWLKGFHCCRLYLLNNKVGFSRTRNPIFFFQFWLGWGLNMYPYFLRVGFKCFLC